MLNTPNCFKRKCIWFGGVKQPDGTELTEHLYCEAFPKGIPDNIAYGNHKHLRKHPDQEPDNDFVYEKNTEQ